MDAFELYKKQYVEAKIAFATSRELFFSGTEIAKSEGRDTKTDPECEALRIENWKASIKLNTAAEYLAGCIAQEAMKRLRMKGHGFLIGITPDIQSMSYPSYRFKIEMLHILSSDDWEDNGIDLNELSNRIKFGVFDFAQAKAWLEKAGVHCSNVFDYGWHSDNEILSYTFEHLVSLLLQKARLDFEAI